MKKLISLLMTALMVFSILPLAVMQDAHAAASLVVTGGTYYYDGHEHDVTVEVKDGTDYTIEYSTDGGKTWTQDSPTLTDPGKITVHVRAKKGTELLTHDPVTLEVTETAPEGSTIKIIAHESDTKAPVRESASSTSKELGTLSAGTTCTLISQSDKWFKVTDGKLTGYVYYWFVKVVSTPGEGGEGGEGTPDLSKVKLTVTGGTFLYDGEAHKVVAKLADGEGFTVEYSTDNGKTWSTQAPSLTSPGKLTVKVQATSTAGIKTHPDVVLQVVSTLPSGTKVKIKAHGSTTKAPIRKAASSSSTKLGTVAEGKEVGFLEKNDEWVKITYGELEGYVYYWFVDFSNIELKPSISVQPESVTAAVDTNAVFKVTAKGEGKLSYQWQDDSSGWADVADGGTSPSYSVKATAANDGLKVRCIVTDENGSVTSSEATLTVITAAPTITKQPANTDVVVGEKVTFSVTASGDALSYQWYYRASDESAWVKASSQKASLAVTTKASYDGRQYKCEVSNPCGKVESDIATLGVITKPVITTQPADKTVNSGEKTTFKVVALGKSLTYKWQYRTSPTAKWKDTTGKKASYSVTTKAALDGYEYRCMVKNSYGTVYSDPATLTVVVVPPTISTQPVDTTVNAGAKATFTVKAASSDLTYQWEYRKDSSSAWKKVTSAAGKKASYTLTAKEKHNGYQYRCLVKNPAGDVYSVEVTLTVITTPVITKEPVDTTAKAGKSTTLKVTAKGPSLKYQWYYRTSPTGSWKKVSGATKASYKFTPKAKQNGYQYRCVIKNSFGKTTSATIDLTVTN